MNGLRIADCGLRITRSPALRSGQSAIVQAFRPGYTLIELVLAMAIAAILLTGMSASIVIASRTVSDGYDVVGLALRTSDSLGEVNSDLSTAEAFLDRTSSSVTFTVPDRDGDGTVVFNGFGQADSGGQVVLKSGNLTRTITLDAASGKASVR